MSFDPKSCPFVGLRPFDSDESLLFFGRQNQILELLQRLHRYHFVAVIGGSGSGKSSIIKAGLIPRLKAGYLVNNSDRWMIAAMKPGQNPLYNLADTILTLPGLSDFINRDYTVSDLLTKIEEEGVDAILNILKPVWANETNFFLLVDQFEELFRFSFHDENPDKKDNAIDFVNILLQLSTQADLSIYVVITMRSDFIGDCAQFYGLPEAMNRSQYLIPRLNRIQLETTIEGPVRLFNEKINPALTAKLLNDAQAVKDELPLLQHALMRIWEVEKNIDKNGEFDLEDYKKIGGIKKALSNHADEALDGMSEVQLNLTKKIFQALTAIDENGRKIRRPVLLSQLQLLTGADKNTLLDIINRFIEGNKSFLIINDVEDKNDALIDISHESLIRQWDILNRWVDEEAESGKMFLRLSESTRLYNEKKKDLLSGNELHQFLQWYHTFHPDVNWAERYSADYKTNIEYLKESEKEEKTQLLKKRRNRRALIAALLLVILIISGFALVIYKNDIANKRSLALNYWKSGEAARAENNMLAGLHLIADAIITTNDKELIKNLLIDGEAYLPHTILQNIFPQEAIVNTAVFSPDGKNILIAGNDGIARVINKVTGEQIGQEMKHSMPVLGAAFSPDGKLILTITLKSIFIWDINTYKQIHIFKEESGVNSAAFSPDGKLVVAALSDNYAQIWQIGNEKKTDSFEHVSEVTTAVFSPDETEILTTCNDVIPHLWNLVTKKEIRFSDSSIYKNESIVLSTSFSPDGTKILTRNNDSTCFVWDITGKQLARFKQGDKITDATFSPDGKWVLTASRDKSVRLWNISTQQQVGTAMKHDGPVYSTAFSGDENEILTAGWDKTVRLWKIESPVDDKKIIFRQNGILTSCAFNPDGKKILTSGFDSTARLWDVASGKQINLFKHGGKINAAIFSTDGTKILTASDDSTVRVWDAMNGEQKKYIKLNEKANDATFSTDGKRVLTVGSQDYSSYINIWNAETKTIQHPLDTFKFQHYINKAIFSKDAKTILIAGDSSAQIIDVATGKQVMFFQHENEVTDAVFSPDEKQILTAGVDYTARIWDVTSGKQIGPSMKHNAAVNSAVFSNDGKWIVTSGWDMEAHIWNSKTFKELGAAKEHKAPITNAVFSRDSKWILTSGYDSTARLWAMEGDVDLPVNLFKLQAKATTGVEYNLLTGETQCIPIQEWRTLKEQYGMQAEKHYRVCKYPEHNLWRKFNKTPSLETRNATTVMTKNQ